jgi:uncharacterized protein (DUF1778 family)
MQLRRKEGISMPVTRATATSGHEPKRDHAKRGRFNARLTAEQKLLFERAAALYGQSVSQFVMSSAQRVAEQAIREHEVISLSARDSAAVMEALLHPAPPNDALRRAVARHRDLVGEE